MISWIKSYQVWRFPVHWAAHHIFSRKTNSKFNGFLTNQPCFFFAKQSNGLNNSWRNSPYFYFFHENNCFLKWHNTLTIQQTLGFNPKWKLEVGFFFKVLKWHKADTRITQKENQDFFFIFWTKGSHNLSFSFYCISMQMHYSPEVTAK